MVFQDYDDVRNPSVGTGRSQTMQGATIPQEAFTAVVRLDTSEMPLQLARTEMSVSCTSPAVTYVPVPSRLKNIFAAFHDFLVEVSFDLDDRVSGVSRCLLSVRIPGEALNAIAMQASQEKEQELRRVRSWKNALAPAST
jgi:hypothetical protein